jgi:hypothetical protein
MFYNGKIPVFSQKNPRLKSNHQCLALSCCSGRERRVERPRATPNLSSPNVWWADGERSRNVNDEVEEAQKGNLGFPYLFQQCRHSRAVVDWSRMQLLCFHLDPGNEAEASIHRAGQPTHLLVRRTANPLMTAHEKLPLTIFFFRDRALARISLSRRIKKFLLQTGSSYGNSNITKTHTIHPHHTRTWL